MAHWKPRDAVAIDAIAPGLHRISARRASAHGALYAYFLERPDGNVLFHGPDRIPFYRQQAEFFDERGGIAVQALTHYGDAGPACAHVQKVWGAPVRVNEWDLDHARRATGLAIERGFANDAPLVPGVLGVHLPGHSVGFTGFRFAVAGSTYLVVGHGVRQLPSEGGWAIATGGPLIEVALRTLDKLAELEVDFLLPDSTRWGPAPPLAFGPAERAAIRESARAYLIKKRAQAGEGGARRPASRA